MIKKYFLKFLTEIDRETLTELTWNIDEMNSNEILKVNYTF